MVSASGYYHPSYGDLKEKLLALSTPSFPPWFSMVLITSFGRHCERGERKRKLCFQFHVVSFFFCGTNMPDFSLPLSFYTPTPKRNLPWRVNNGKAFGKEKESSVDLPRRCPPVPFLAQRSLIKFSFEADVFGSQIDFFDMSWGVSSSLFMAFPFLFESRRMNWRFFSADMWIRLMKNFPLRTKIEKLSLCHRVCTPSYVCFPLPLCRSI